MSEFYQADGLRFRVARPIEGLTPEQIDAADAVAVARLPGGAVVAGTATVEAGHILVDFGAGALPPGQYSVQVRLTVAGRPATVFDARLQVRASLQVAE